MLGIDPDGVLNHRMFGSWVYSEGGVTIFD